MTAEQLYKKAETFGGIVNRRIDEIEFPNPIHLKTYSEAIDLVDVINNSDNIPICIDLYEPIKALRKFLVREKKKHETED